MSLDQEPLPEDQGTDPYRLRPLEAGGKQIEARQAVIDCWMDTKGWSVSGVYTLIQNTQRLYGKAAKRKVEAETSGKTETTETTGEVEIAVAIEKAPDPKGERIRSLYHEMVGFVRKTLDHVVEIGQILNEKKDIELPHGEYRRWEKENCPFGIGAAENYRRIYLHRNEILRDEIITFSQARKYLKKKPSEHQKRG